MLERVQKIIANAGFCSRRKAEELIERKKVRVNGKLITIGDKADAQKDQIEIAGKKLHMEKRIYVAFNKPKGFICALSDPYKKTIFDLIHIKERIFPIGRLDENSEGLLLLTNDGDFANQIMHPRYEVRKSYQVTVNKPLQKRDKVQLEQGLVVGGRKTSTAHIQIASKEKFTISIHEGRNRIVRRMLKKLGYIVLRLKRVSIGTVKIGSLKPGAIRHLTEKEVKSLVSEDSRKA